MIIIAIIYFRSLSIFLRDIFKAFSISAIGMYFFILINSISSGFEIINFIISLHVSRVPKCSGDIRTRSLNVISHFSSSFLNSSISSLLYSLVSSMLYLSTAFSAVISISSPLSSIKYSFSDITLICFFLFYNNLLISF